MGGKLTRSEAGKPQHKMLNSWKSGLKTRYYFLILLFLVRIEKKITKPGPVSTKGLGWLDGREMSSAEQQQPGVVV